MRTLFVSFIGNTDCDHVDPARQRARVPLPGCLPDESPVMRFMLGVVASAIPIDVQKSRLLLLDDDSGNPRHQTFITKLRERLEELKFSQDMVQTVPLSLKGPTDRDGLYSSVWEAIPGKSVSGVKRHFFHLSSGTPAMQTTLLLAASCMNLPDIRIFETSNKPGREFEAVELPYLLGLRERVLRDRRATRKDLPQAALKALSRETICADPAVRHAYAALFDAARRKGPQRLLLRGPTGSGKHHAARQFASWRHAEVIECPGPDALPQSLDAAESCVVIRRLDNWAAEAMEALSAWCVRFRSVSVVATWRTDQFSAAGGSVTALHGLLGAASVEFPSLSARDDIPELAAALARKRGILDGRLHDRFQFDYVAANFPRGLHDLETLIATVANHSNSLHPGADGRKQAIRLLDADAARIALRENFEALSGQYFGVGLPTLEQRLVTIKDLTVRVALATGGSNEEVARRLGFATASAVTKIRNRRSEPGE